MDPTSQSFPKVRPLTPQTGNCTSKQKQLQRQARQLVFWNQHSRTARTRVVMVVERGILRRKQTSHQSSGAEIPR
jgi:hypothetical protein